MKQVVLKSVLFALLVSLALVAIFPQQVRRRPISAGFSPASLGFEVWIEADGLTGLSDFDPIPSATDLSGNGNHYTASGSTRPLYRTNFINGKPAMEFDGTDDYLQGPNFTVNSTCTLYAILYKSAAGSGDKKFGALRQITYLNARRGGDDFWGISLNADLDSSYSLNTSFKLIAIVINGANDVKLYTNNNTVQSFTSATAVNTEPGENRISTATGGQGFQGYVAAWFVDANSAHDSTTISNMKAWLNTKYAIY